MISSFAPVLFATSLVVLVAAAAAWRRRKVSGGVALTLMLVATAVWSFFSRHGDHFCQ